jgi:hypothetical protein
MRTKIAKNLIESFEYVSEAADPVKVNRFIQLVNSGQMSSELQDLQQQLKPEMMSSDALAKAFSKLNGMMIDKIATNKNPQGPVIKKTAPGTSAQKPNTPTTATTKVDPKVLQLQKDLIAKGAKIKADGIMGPQTQAAQKQFGATPAPKIGGGARAAQTTPAPKPVSNQPTQYDDMPPIVPTAPQHITNSSPASQVSAEVAKLPPAQILDLHNKLKAKTQDLGVIDAQWWRTPIDTKANLSMFSSEKMTPELQKLISMHKTDAIGYLNAMKAQNKK